MGRLRDGGRIGRVPERDLQFTSHSQGRASATDSTALTVTKSLTIDEPAADADWISGRLPLPNTNAHIHAATPVATQANSHSSEPGAPKAEVRANAAKDIAPRLTETFDAQAARFVDNVRARVDEMLGHSRSAWISAAPRSLPVPPTWTPVANLGSLGASSQDANSRADWSFLLSQRHTFQ